IDEGADEAAIFMPFAGTEGYNPVAYIPYIAAAAIGRVANLEFPNLLLLMRLAGVIAFTAVAAYALAVTPVLRWAFVLIALLPVFVLSPLCVVAVSAEIAAWRLQLEERHPPEHFDPIWKLFFMWENPSHFPLATWRAITGWGDRLWQELIGILGWQDVLLPY